MTEVNSSFRLAAYAGIRELISKKGVNGAFNSARVCGYDGVELLYIAHECADILNEADVIKSAISESGIGVCCISCFADAVTKEKPYKINDSAIEAIKRCVDLAKEISCPIVHHTLVTRLTGNREDYHEVLPVAIEAASEIAAYADKCEIDIVYEPQGMLFNGLDGYSEFFDIIKSRYERVGLCLDVGNTLWVDEECYELAEKYREHIKHVHVKDYVLGVDEEPHRTLGQTTIKEVALGSGVIDIQRILNILTTTRYKGLISVEDNSGLSFECAASNAKKIIR